MNNDIPDILLKIIEHKKIEIAKIANQDEIIFSSLNSSLNSLSFVDALQKDHLAIISEVKKASPSAGIIREDFDHVKIASEYEKAGASAISVLTDEHFFQGSSIFLKDIAEHAKIPILRKDFIIDEIQIYEAALWGASAFLLIAAVLSVEEMQKFIRLGRSLNMDALVEIHTEKELEKALIADAAIIGINNRNLRTFTVDLAVSELLAEKIPEGKIIVGESGIKTHEDAQRLKKAGCNALLIGETLMKCDYADYAKKMSEFF